jgi:predicted PurR-regulated permease PerM
MNPSSPSRGPSGGPPPPPAQRRPITDKPIPPQAGQSSLTLAGASITGLFLLALLHTLHVARALFLPITLALLLYLLLIPVVRSLTRLRLPEPAGAGLVLLLFSVAVAAGLYSLADPAREWMDKIPSALETLDAKLRPVKQSVKQMTEAKTAVEQMAQGPAAGPAAQEVAVKTDWQVPVLGWTTAAAAEIGAAVVLLYFLLCSGDFFTHKLLIVLPTEEDRRRVGDIIRGIERQLSRFLFNSLLQNAGAAALFALALWVIGMPNPALWGAATLLLQFIPYLGTIFVVGVVSLAALLTFQDLWWIAFPGLFYLALMWIKGMFVTPTFLGRRLALNPVAVLVSLLLWGWVWGIAGVFLAVPLFATLKIVCDHIPRLQSLGQFLGR